MQDITTDPALLMAVVEDLVPSLNGPSAQQFTETLEELAFGTPPAKSEQVLSPVIQRISATDRVPQWRSRLRDLARQGVQVITVCDQAYPANLRMIADHPPLLFTRGRLLSIDDRAIAVVGTRTPSPAGAQVAYDIAHELARQGVTVVSGLATGIDTAAHQGSIDGGGRTLAVLGTGIEHIYPSENRALADEVSQTGACVSQFLPAMRPTRWSFPVRNVVTSGLAIGTVIVEASETSGARRQAEAALQQAKRLFLLSSLVRSQAWAAALAEKAGVAVVDGTDEVITAIDAELSVGSGLL
jgi:DNA processing protein